MADTFTNGEGYQLTAGVESALGSAVTPTIRLRPKRYGIRNGPRKYVSGVANGTMAVNTAQEVNLGFDLRGPVELEALLSQMTDLMKLCLGVTGGVAAWAGTLGSWTFEESLDGVKVHTHDGCVVNTWKLESSQGDPATLSLDVVGMTQVAGDAKTTVALPPLASDILQHGLAVVTVASYVCKCRRVSVSGSNGLNDGAMNTQENYPRADGYRPISYSMDILFNAQNYPLYTAMQANTTVAMSVQWKATAATSITFASATCKVLGDLPEWNGVGEKWMTVNLAAQWTTLVTEMLTLTIDVTP
jgi:hypothetical protein